MTEKPTQVRKSNHTSSTAKPVPVVYDYDTLHKEAQAGFRRAKELYAAKAVRIAAKSGTLKNGKPEPRIDTSGHEG